MKQYPSIPTLPRVTLTDGSTRLLAEDLDYYWFDKLDGSQIRVEWSRKRGFYKFGSSGRLVDPHDPVFGGVPALVQQKYSEPLGRVLHDSKVESAVAYLEYHSPNTLAGVHVEEPHDITLFDVAFYKRGILMPEDFLRIFGHLDTPRLLHQGRLTEDFADSVVNSTLAGMTLEGVVGKARPSTKTLQPAMVKIKSKIWIAKLAERYRDDTDTFVRLL